MNLDYVLKDEKNIAGQTLTIHKGELKTIKVFWFNQDGSPYVCAGITAMVVKIFKGTGITPLSKTIVDNDITLISSDDLGGAIGFQFSITAAESAALPVSSTVGMSAKVTVSTTAVDEQDFPSAFNVTAPLVP